MTHDPQDHATRATLRALDAQRADTLADALRPVAAPVAPSLDLDAIVTLLNDGGTICQCGENIAQWECECGELTCNDCGNPYDPSGPHHGHSREELPRFGKEHGAALVAEARRLRMELHGAQHALAEASRGRAAASLRAADAEHVATVAMRDGLRECESLRRYTVQLKASCRAAAADAEQSGRTNARSQQEVGRLRGVLHVLNTASAADAHRSTAAALELANLRAEERDAANTECERLRAQFVGLRRALRRCATRCPKCARIATKEDPHGLYDHMCDEHAPASWQDIPHAAVLRDLTAPVDTVAAESCHSDGAPSYFEAMGMVDGGESRGGE